jgi:hypothetical protein
MSKAIKIQALIWISILWNVFISSAQISLNNYPKQFECQIDAISDIEIPKAVSTCSEITSTFSDQIFSGGCLGTLVRTYSFKDTCGNAATAEQYISLKDNQAPNLIGEAKDMMVKKGQAIPKAVELSSQDNSGQVYPVTMQENTSKNLITRTYSCEDACGNRIEVIQRITIID